MTSALLKEVVFMLSIGIIVQWEEEFGDAKWIIKIHKSKKDRQHNDQKKKSKMTNNDLQNINLTDSVYPLGIFKSSYTHHVGRVKKKNNFKFNTFTVTE
jgi:hypothetical protein